MSAQTVPTGGSGRRRRPRRGSLSRPVNSGLYRASLLVVLLPLLLLAFSVEKPAPLAKPTLPGSFDTAAAVALAKDLSTAYPNRTPGAIGPVSWFKSQLPVGIYGLKLQTSSWRERVPGLGRVRLHNVAVVAPGPPNVSRPDTIVVMAHRDDLGLGQGANDNASGTAALIELARAYAQPQTEAAAQVTSPRRIVFLSTDGGAVGGLGAAHFLAHPPFPRPHRLRDQPRRDRRDGEPEHRDRAATPRTRRTRRSSRPRSRGSRSRPARRRATSGFLGQLIDLAFPFTLYEQGPFVGAGHPGADDHDRRRPPARALRRHRRTPSTRRGSDSSAPPRSSCSARSTRD